MEGKKKYFALVLFLFIGLMIFTFANPGEESKEFKDGESQTEFKEDTNKREDDASDEETTEDEEETNEQQQAPTNPVQHEEGQGNTVGQDEVQTENRVDTTLRDALAAVELAEGSYKEADVDTAKNLIEQVTDTTEKGKLESRLEEVENGIAVMALLDELESKLEDASKKDDITAAIAYRDQDHDEEKAEVQNLQSLIDALTNETVADALQERLDTINEVLNDTTAPKVNIADNQASKTNLTISLDESEDENAVTIYLSKDGSDETVIANNTATTANGIYTLRVVDEAFNETGPIRFVVDGVEPTFVGLTYGGHYPSVKIDVADLSLDKITVFNQDTNKTTEVANETELTEDATYKIIATDEAGNSKEIWVAVDNKVPTITGTDPDSNTQGPVTLEIFDKYLTTVTVDKDGNETEYVRNDFTVGANNKNWSFNPTFTEEGVYTVTVTDQIGLSETISFEIDLTPPELNFSNGSTYDDFVVKATDKNFSHLLIYREGIKKPERIDSGTWTLAKENTKFKVYAYDIAGNYTAKAIFHDNSKPALTGKFEQAGKEVEFQNNGIYQNAEFTITDNDLASVKITDSVNTPIINKTYAFANGDETFSYALPSDGIYTITAKDRTGNEDTWTFEIDTQGPEFNFSNGNTFADFTVVVTDKNFAYMELFDYKTEEPRRIDANTWRMNSGNQMYKIYAYDLAGNKSKIMIYHDDQAPAVTGEYTQGGQIVEYKENEEYQKAVLTVTDADLKSVEIKNSKNEEVISKSYKWEDADKTFTYTLDKDEVYTITAKDRAGNETTWTVEIDATAPVINNGNLKGQKLNHSVTIRIKEDNIKTVTLYKNDVEVKNYQDNMYELSHEGVYKIVVVDKAGNETIGQFEIDKTAPEATYVQMATLLGLTEGYAKVGNNIWVYVNFSEKLSQEPKFKINGVEGTIVQRAENINQYVGQVEMTSEMTEGEVKFEIYGYKDEAGNEGEVITNQDITAGPEKILLDKTPVVTSLDGRINVNGTDTNPFKVETYKDGKLVHTAEATYRESDNKYFVRYNISWLGYGEYESVYTDRAGNVSKETYDFVADPVEPENGVAEITENKVYIDEAFYNDATTTEDVTFNGNGKTIEGRFTSEDEIEWINNETYPTKAIIFSSSNGAKNIVNDLTFAGTFNTIMLGNYVKGNSTQQSNFNTELNNVNVINTKVFSFSAGIAPAVATYGKVTLNNTNIYGTTLSELDTTKWPVYDLAITNYSNVEMTNSKVGSIVIWEHGKVTVKAGSTVDKVVMYYTKNESGLIKGDIIVEDGATVKEVVVGDKTYTYEEWYLLKNKKTATTETELNNAINNATGPQQVVVASGTYTLPSLANKEVVISGTKDTIIDMTTTKPSTNNAEVTFDGVTVKFDHDYTGGFTHSKKVVYKNATIIGTQWLYAENVEFIDCTFERVDTTTEYNVWTYGAKNVTFTNCIFNTGGKAVLVYTQSENHANIVFNKCTFNSDKTFTEKAAVEVGSSEYSADTTYNLTFNDCKENGFEITPKGINTGSALWGNKNSMDKDHLNVIIDGVDVY